MSIGASLFLNTLVRFIEGLNLTDFPANSLQTFSSAESAAIATKGECPEGVEGECPEGVFEMASVDKRVEIASVESCVGSPSDSEQDEDALSPYALSVETQFVF